MITKNLYEIECSLSQFYGYAYYISGIKMINRLYVKNLSKEDLKDAVLNITSAGFLLPFSKIFAIIPYESTIDVDTSDLSIDPSMLINLNEKQEITVEIELVCGSVKAHNSVVVTVLPYTMYYGLDTYPELLSCFINPYQPQLQKIIKSAFDTLKGWKYNHLLQGYEDTNKNSVRLITAALYRALLQKNISICPDVIDSGKPLSIKNVQDICSDKNASILDMAVLFAATAEAIGLNSVIAAGKNNAVVGVWLTDNCFLESSFDEVSELKKRADDLINDIVIFDINCLFEKGKQNFAASEKSATELLNGNNISYVIDIKRCRIANFKPLPLRFKSGDSYELMENDTDNFDQMPKDKKKNIRYIKTKPQPTKESQWERRLLDLSLKNNLLNFVPKNNMLKIMSVSAENTASALFENKEYSLLEIPSEFLQSMAKVGNFNTSNNIRPLSALITLEQKNGRIRTFCDVKTLNSAASALYRKEKILSEETGTSALYAACGFLKWTYSTEKDNCKYAPLVLIPISLSKKKAGKGYTIALREEEIQFNTTLAELLKQEFGIEMRGIDNVKQNDIESILAAVKKQILGFKGWEVTEDVYIASLSFSRYLMWKDIRTNIDTFRKNKIISSLLQNKVNESLIYQEKQSSKEKAEIFLPITADESQTKAVKLSDKNVSFILHGPPGTGKSQTITNIIANALAKNKKVLFVAEKQAALSVVKKRLDSIGIGDFCLELYSDKSVKTEVCKKLYETSRLTSLDNSSYNLELKHIKELKTALKLPFDALHKKRRLGLSVYEGILKQKEYESAADVLNIDSLFYEKLTPEKLAVYENLLAELVTVSKECGSLYRSPFENVGLTEYDDILIPNIITSEKILFEEARHLKAYTRMCFDILGGKLRVVTKKKLLLVKELCQNITKPNNPYKKMFENVKGIDAVKILNVFVSVYKEFEKKEKEYNLIFKNKFELPASTKLLREELEIFPLEFHKSKPLRVLIKRMNKSARQKIRPENLRENIEKVLNYHENKAQTASAGENLSALLGEGRVNYNQVAEFILGLDVLYNAVSKLFMHYDRISFNLMLENLFTKYPAEIFNSFLRAYDNFENAKNRFFNLLKIGNDYDNIGEDYTEFIGLKAASIKDNIDMLSSWCRFNNVSRKLKDEGLKFVLAPIKEGKVTGEQITSCFYKKVYTDFVTREIAEDPILSKFSSAIIEEKIEKYRLLTEEFEKTTCQEIKLKLIQKLPSLSTEGPLSVELMRLQRAYKSNMRGITVRNILQENKNLFGVLAPCLLMSPGAVAKYLDAGENFDLVVFDEASQIPTAEAIGSIARGKSAVIVGDPKQLPPTTFFTADYTDEDNLQFEDLESILEDCLALGLPERYLKWHYRSKHESLIAFSNALYYGNKLCTFPSTDSLQSKVQLKYIENGVYDRGRTKQNVMEADCLISEVIKRLRADNGKGQSIGIVTFSVAQQTLIENKISDALIKNKLEMAAYDRDEPLFVKNLENVQGDERDLILFSVCYGPDRYGKLSLNFGPVNQANGWRRLNVAASRAREEMIIYSSITSAMIDLSKNNSKGVAGIKAFLEFAQNGRSMLAVKSFYVENAAGGIGKFIANDLEQLGYECRYNLGVSDFKIDIAVLDPKNKKFILAIICDSRANSADDIKGNTVLQIKTLKRLNWNVYRLWTLNYLNNPAREIKKIKQFIDKINGTYNLKSENKFAKPYKEAILKAENTLLYFILEQTNGKSISEKLTALIETEQPISKEYLIKKCLLSYGITRSGRRINARMEELVQNLKSKNETINKVTFYRKDDSVLKCDFYRTDDNIKLKRTPHDISPYEYIAVAKSVLADRVSLYIPDLVKEIATDLNSKVNTENDNCIRSALNFANEKGLLTISVNGMVTV